MTDKEKFRNTIKDLMELESIQGKHQGRWQYCEDKETIGEEYLKDIMPLALEYGMKFNPELEDNFDHEIWEDLSKFGEGYAIDELGYETYERLKGIMLERIGEYIENNGL